MCVAQTNQSSPTPTSLNRLSRDAQHSQASAQSGAPDSTQQFPQSHTSILCFLCLMCLLWLNFKRVALAERVEHAKCSATSCRQLFKTYRSWTTFHHARANLSDLRLLAFVLCLQRYLLFASVFVNPRASIIVEHENPPCSKDLNAFLCESFVAFAQIGNASVRPIRESQSYKYRIGINDLAGLRTDRLCKHRHR